jgi:hypothetical protein
LINAISKLPEKFWHIKQSVFHQQTSSTKKGETMKLRMILIALALILVISVVPCTAKNLDKNTYGGDVYRYEFGTVEMGDDYIDLCWALDDEQPDGVDEAATKFSIVLYGPLAYSFGTIEPYTVVEDADMSIDYATTDQCIELDIAMIEAEVLAGIAEAEGISVDDIQDFTFDIMAKVKGLDTVKQSGKKSADNVKRQDNWFSPPVEVGSLEWSAEPLPVE